VSARKAKRLPKARPQHFTLDEPAVRLAGTPPPLPCPWCDEADGVTLVLNDPASDGTRSAHCECTVCGAEAPGAFSGPEDHKDSQQLVVEAAQMWNQRGGLKP
jgi:hypothetical protein